MSDLKTPAAPKAPFTKGSGPLGTDTTGVLVAEPKGRTGASRILLGRDAIMIYALLVVVIGACLLIPRFASPSPWASSSSTSYRSSSSRCR